MAAANVSSILAVGLDYDIVEVGSISAVETLNTGNYTIMPETQTIDTRISAYNFPDGEGGIMGENAIISANPIVGGIRTVKIHDPGVLYNKDETVILTNISRAEASNATRYYCF